MEKKTLIVFGAIILLLVGVLGFLVWQKSQVKVPASSEKKQSEAPIIKKVDLASQPEWVQKLDVKLTRGASANGLKNFTFTINNMPKGEVKSLTYIAQYQTLNKGAQGALATKPVEINGATKYSKTIDFGTCSTKSCVVHEGVTSVDLELDFISASDQESTWTKTLELP